MSTNVMSRFQKPKNAKFDTNSGRKMKAKMVISKTFLSLPVSRQSSVTCSSRKITEKSRSGNLRSTQSKISQRKETSFCKQDDMPYYFSDDENKQGPLKNSPAGRKKKTNQSEVKQIVLRTISRMLHENRIIRKQWLSVSYRNNENTAAPNNF